MIEKEIQAYVGTKAMISNEKNEILIIQAKWGGKWEFPGGRINKEEIDQSIEKPLMREIEEELGGDFKIEITNIFDTFFRKFSKPKNPEIEQVFVVVYLCKYLSGEIKMQEEEILDFAWVNKNNWNNYEYANGYKKVIEKYFENK